MATAYKGETRRPARQDDDGREALQQGLHGLLCKLPWKGSGGADDLRTIGVTSCNRGEGVSTVAAELAQSAAQCGERRVLLVDCNLQHPSVHRRFAVSMCPGLADVLREGADEWPAIQASPLANLSLLPAGKADAHRPWHYEAAQLPAIVQALRGDFDLVVFDMPAVLEEASAGGIASLLDGVLLVVEAERIRWEAARRGQQALLHAQRACWERF